MSLKSKMEAVIYASEEPVTLAQLVSLLGEEAQAELDRQQELDLQLATEAAEGEAFSAEVAEGEAVSAEVPEGEATAAENAGDTAPAEETGAPAEGAEVTAVSETASEATPETPTAEGEPEAEGSGKKKKLTDAEKAAARRLREHFRKELDQLVRDYSESERGLEIREVAGGYRFATKPEFHDAVRGFVKSLKPPLKLSLPALETLAVIAYKQPVTSPEISEIRGVDSGGVLGSLMARKLITTAGRKQVIGRPILYKTTKDFLLKFGLKDVSELPSIEEFEKMAGEMAEQEEIPMGEPAVGSNDDAQANDHPGDASEESAVEPQADGSGDVADETVVDGRSSGLPPHDEVDPSGQEAATQEESPAEAQEENERARSEE